MSDHDGNMNMILMVGLAFVAGAATALLLAPSSGDETRRKIGRLAGKAGDVAHEGMDSVQGYVDLGKDRLDEFTRGVGSRARGGGDSLESILTDGKDRIEGGLASAAGTPRPNTTR